MKIIEHSNPINDFLVFYIQTKVDGELCFESVIDYLSGEFTICNLHTQDERKFKFESQTESKIEEQIKQEVEKLIL